MRGFTALKRDLSVLKNENFSVSPEIEEAIENYQHYAEEAEQAILKRQESERQSNIKQEISIK